MTRSRGVNLRRQKNGSESRIEHTRAARLVLGTLAAGAAGSGGSRKSGGREGRKGQERSHETDHCVRLCTEGRVGYVRNQNIQEKVMG